MSKFKVGDKVRRKNHDHASLKVGQVGCVRNTDSTGVQIDGEDNDFWHQDGNLELVTEGPVRTVTRREIVPGTYDGVRVGDVDGGYVTILGLTQAAWSADELRSAAMILSQLAEFADDTGEGK